MKAIPEVFNTNDAILIVLRREDLIAITEGRSDGIYKVLWMDDFMQEVTDKLRDFQYPNDVEKGITALQSLIDKCVEEVVTDGSGSVDYQDLAG